MLEYLNFLGILRLNAQWELKAVEFLRELAVNCYKLLHFFVSKRKKTILH